MTEKPLRILPLRGLHPLLNLFGKYSDRCSRGHSVRPLRPGHEGPRGFCPIPEYRSPSPTSPQGAPPWNPAAMLGGSPSSKGSHKRGQTQLSRSLGHLSRHGPACSRLPGSPPVTGVIPAEAPAEALGFMEQRQAVPLSSVQSLNP